MMAMIKKSVAKHVTWVAFGWLALFSAGAAAQSVGSAEALQIFQNLTPEQQQALMQQMSGGQQGSVAAPSGSRRQTNPDAENERLRAGRLAAEEPDDLLLRPEDTVVIELSVPEEVVPAERSATVTPGSTTPTRLTPADIAAAQRRQRMVSALDVDERRKLDELVALVLSRNPYTLDRNAQLNLPGFAPIAVGGLSEEQATQRLSLEPVLLPLEVHVTRLPLAKTGVAGLKPFGYDLFDNVPSTFSPVTDGPVPADYIVGAGDELNVQLFGNQNRSLRLVVSRDGTVSFPELGPIRVAGMAFNAARQAIELRVSQQMIGVQASVSMGEMRTIRVLVVGEARFAGSYTVSGLATLRAALFASGGVKPIGSLRDIQLRRQDTLVRRLDLYDLLISGNTRDDVQLQSGDVIFIPLAGPTVAVEGEVRRPAIYELRGETSVADVVRIAGGLTAEADVGRVSVTRIDESGRRVVLDVNLNQPASSLNMRNGDVLRIATLRPQIDEGVVLEGFVHRPGPFAWRDGLRLTDVIGSVDELRPNADQRYVLIRRESGLDRRVSVLSADLVAALQAPGSAADVQLAPRDRVIVFDLAPGRERIIRPLMDELRLQSGISRPTEQVRVEGNVRVPGEYPLEPNMRVSDLLRAGGTLSASAYGGTAELARYTLGNDGARQTELITVDLAAVLRGEPEANLVLRPYDHLLVKETPDWSDRESVTLRGEVKFPGTYPIRKGETLRELLERAGGLTALAFPEGSVFMRKDLKEIEQQNLDRLADQMRGDIAVLSMQAAYAGQANASQALMAGQSLLQDLQGAKATGRFVIDLPGLLAQRVGGTKDVVLRNGDELLIPRQRQEVTVIGEIQNATSHLFQPNLSRDDYIAMSGGTSVKADKRRIYVVRADGSVAVRGGSRFARNYNVSVRPGDTIVVPLDTERMPRLPFWQAVTQILYNVAVSVAAINSF